MDGWESRRKRVPGHDWAVIKLATTGKITGFDIDTNFFLGNHPPHASVEACLLPQDQSVIDWESEVKWVEILPKSPLDAGSQNFFEINNSSIYSHLRLHIYPDGGVARLKVYGEVFKRWEDVKSTDVVDLAAAINGGKAIACNDMFFSEMGNLIMPGRGVNMGDGWETKRNRTPGNRDWVVLKLAVPGFLENFLVDTAHFKGNYPDRCSIEACNVKNDEDSLSESGSWKLVLPESKLQADHIHEFESHLKSEVFTHLRLNIFPDGGISRLRAFGRKSN
jgi:allantoicase